MSVIPIVIQQHAEEAAILWLRRDHAVGEPHYSLADLAKLDDQLEAHIDGLRIAGDDGWEICQQELSWEEPGEVFAAAVLALESGNAERIARCSRSAARPRIGTRVDLGTWLDATHDANQYWSN